MSFILHHGDSREVIKTLADNSIDSVCTDPPYALVSIVKRFGKDGSAAVKVPEGGSGAYARASSGFMGKKWDTGETAFDPAFWAEVLRVLKPGGHVVSFSGTRTYHRMACAIEDSGFEIRDMLSWLYGSGFPKSHDVSKGIDRAAGKLGAQSVGFNVAGKSSGLGTIQRPELRSDHPEYRPYSAATDEAETWQGWGTALKPACEPICLARKPLIGTVAANVMAHGTGALNINGTRIGTRIGTRTVSTGDVIGENTAMSGPNYGRIKTDETTEGRWPANIVHDGSEEVLDAFPNSESSRSEVTSKPGAVYGNGSGLPSHTGIYGFDNSGSAARFFYTAKADAEDRFGSKHPTVKPVDLMQWLVRLVTPKGGLVLDPFAGTGTTGEAAIREGMSCILIEREEEYLKDIRIRMELAEAGPMERQHGRVKNSGKADSHDSLPLFGGAQEKMRGGGQTDLRPLLRSGQPSNYGTHRSKWGVGDY